MSGSGAGERYVIRVGTAVFEGTAGEAGIKTLRLPPMGVGVRTLSRKPARDPKLALLPAASEAIYHVEDLAGFLAELLSGRDPGRPPACDLSQVSDFTHIILTAVGGIPWGAVSSYSDIAAHAGRRGASRAAGSAIGRNPVALVIPCHRVIRSDGGIGGWSGLPGWKEWLLDLESTGPLHASA